MADWFKRLKAGLKKSSDKLSSGLNDILTKRKIDAEMLDELEEALIAADVGYKASAEIVKKFAARKQDKDASKDEIKQALAAETAALLKPCEQKFDPTAGKPHVVLMVGVNGAGKTTAIGKLAHKFKNKKISLIAGDTFRAAAVEQLSVWGERNGIRVFAGEQGCDAAGLCFDGLSEAVRQKDDIVFIDTAGLRRKNKIKEEIERYSIIRAVTAVERADVVIIVIDATEGVTEQDAKIAGIAHDRGKGIIIAVNKWDAIEKDNNTVKKHTEKIRQILSFMPYAEILFISAKSGQRLNKIFEMIDVVIENNSMRVATGVLNEIVTEAVAMQQPPTDKGKRLKIYYVTQVAVKPPTFVVFVNDKNLMHFSYTRYLENRIRDTFGFRGTALKFITRERKED